MRDPQSAIGTVLGGRYELGEPRLEGGGASSGALQFDTVDLSSREQLSVRLVPVDLLVDPSAGIRTPAEAVEAFEAQVDLASGLRHPCIESIRDHGQVTLDGEQYVYAVSDRLAGGSLREFLDRGRRLTPSQALIVGIDICRALDAAAKVGVVHGDVRPSRLVFGMDRRIRVVGFGAPHRPVEHLTLDQVNYAAPEVLEGAARSVSSDVYSVALVLIEAMTGEVPFVGDSASTAAANRAGRLLPVSADFGPLAQVIERAGRPAAAERFTPREFGQQLVQAAEKMPRPTPIDIVGTGLFDTEVATGGPGDPTGSGMLHSDVSHPLDRLASGSMPSVPTPPPVPNQAPSGPITIRTTPTIGGREVDTGPVYVPPIDPADPTGMTRGTPLSIGGDDTGPVSYDPEALRILAADDATAETSRRGRRRATRGGGRRILRTVAITAAVVALLGGAGAGAWLTVLNPKSEVPVLAGMSEAEARNELSRFGWGVRVVLERSDEVETGEVIRSEPVAGEQLAKRGTLTLYVSEGPPLVELVELKGLTLEAAKALLDTAGLEYTTEDVEDEEIPAGSVAGWVVPDQPSLAAGDSVVKGASLTLRVSTGPAMRPVPVVVDMTVEEATAALQAAGLVVVTSPTRMPSPTVAAGKVAMSDPFPGTQVAKGTTVTIVISSGKKSVQFPFLKGHEYATVERRLLQAQLFIGKVTGNKNKAIKSASIKGKPISLTARPTVLAGQVVDLVFTN